MVAEKRRRLRLVEKLHRSFVRGHVGPVLERGEAVVVREQDRFGDGLRGRPSVELCGDNSREREDVVDGG